MNVGDDAGTVPLVGDVVYVVFISFALFAVLGNRRPLL